MYVIRYCPPLDLTLSGQIMVLSYLTRHILSQGVVTQVDPQTSRGTFSTQRVS